MQNRLASLVIICGMLAPSGCGDAPKVAQASPHEVVSISPERPGNLPLYPGSRPTIGRAGYGRDKSVQSLQFTTPDMIGDVVEFYLEAASDRGLQVVSINKGGATASLAFLDHHELVTVAMTERQGLTRVVLQDGDRWDHEG